MPRTKSIKISAAHHKRLKMLASSGYTSAKMYSVVEALIDKEVYRIKAMRAKTMRAAKRRR